MTTADLREHSVIAQLALRFVNQWTDEGLDKVYKQIQDRHCRIVCQDMFMRWGRASGVLPPPLVGSSSDDQSYVPSTQVSTDSDNDIGGSDNDNGVSTGPPRFAVMLWRIHALLGAEASVVHWLVNVIKEYPIQRAHVDIVTANHRFQYNAIEDYFSAIIMFPWTWDTVSFAEFYALGTPMFIPSKRFMVPIITSLCITSSQFRFLDTRPYYAVNRTDCSWTSVSPEEERRLGLRPGTSLPRCAGLTEGNRIFQCNAEEFGAWWDQTNYATRPHVQRFDSLNHLLSLFDSFDGSRVLFESIAENMWEDRQGALDFSRDWLKKNFIKKCFGYLARCDFWLKSSSKFWIL